METQVHSLAMVGQQAKEFLSQLNQRMFINGEWVYAIGGDHLEILNPADEKVIGTVPSAGEKDIDLAVSSARMAFDDGRWTGLRPIARQQFLSKLADLIERDGQALSEIEALDNGMPASVAKFVEVNLSVDFLRYMGGWATKIEGNTVEMLGTVVPQDAQFFSYVRREPVGVVAAIVPWNIPLLAAVWKLAPALAAGCTVVLKPAEQTPLAALYLAKLVEEAGFPHGVVNVVTGDGPHAGAPLVRHPGVNKISFTGSTEVGRDIGIAAMDRMARVTLELGGKSPMIVMDDADADVVAAAAAQAIYFNQGQNCCAASRLYVPRRMYDQVVTGLATNANNLKIGKGLDPATQIGPLVSSAQRDRVCEYIDLGRQEGASLVAGGERLDGRGYFVRPTVFSSNTDAIRIVQEEIFGPVVVAMPYDEIDEVVARANDTPYGLAASVWTKDISRAHRIIPQLRAGKVWVNCHNVFDAAVPFGGYKLSGIGKDCGRLSLESYLESKAVVMAV